MLLRFNDTISTHCWSNQKMITPTNFIHRIGITAQAETTYRTIF